MSSLEKHLIRSFVQFLIGIFIFLTLSHMSFFNIFWRSNPHLRRRKFITIQASLKKIETFQINNLTLHLQEVQEQQQRKPRASRRKDILKIRAELNVIETKRIQKINKSRSLFFENIKKIDKPLTRLIKKKRERT